MCDHSSKDYIDVMYSVCFECGEMVLNDNKQIIQRNTWVNENDKRLYYFRITMDCFSGREIFHMKPYDFERLKRYFTILPSTTKQIKQGLKDLKLTKYYNNVYLLLFLISNIKPHVIIHINEIESDFINMFKKFIKLNTNKNFLNNKFILHKLLIKYNEIDDIPYIFKTVDASNRQHVLFNLLQNK